MGAAHLSNGHPSHDGKGIGPFRDGCILQDDACGLCLWNVHVIQETALCDDVRRLFPHMLSFHALEVSDARGL